MRVAMYYNNNDVRLQEMPVPDISPDEILVKVVACGICGSDVMEWYRIKKAPIVLGHEIAGDIVKVGVKVRNFKVGDRVFVSHHVPCLSCKYCNDDHTSVCDTLRSTNFYPGGFSEYIRVPKINVDRGVFKLPDEISYDEGVFIEPLACIYRGQAHAHMKKGKTVIVLGSGISGLLHIQLARVRGAKRVIATDINGFRLDVARKLGADNVINAKENVPEKLLRLNDGYLANLVIVSTGALPAIKQSFKCVDRGGTILFFAPTTPGLEVGLPFNELWKDEVSMTTSYAGSPTDIANAIEIIRDKKINLKDMITHRLPLSETQKGFKLTSEGKNSIKVIIEPQK